MDHTEREAKMKSRDLRWSEIFSDALQLILESLSLPDFHRARTVCSTWYSVSKSCLHRYPWLIRFPKKLTVTTDSRNLFDPVAYKWYETRSLGDDELSESRCLASYGNWLLMLNPRIDFSVLNVFSGERIDLPELSLRGEVSLRRKDDGDFLLEHSSVDRETIIERYVKRAVLWIDERTRDFVVSWIYNDRYLFSYKKGDDCWWHFHGTECLDMAYKDSKLFVYTSDHFIEILDFDSPSPNEITGDENPYWNRPFQFVPQLGEYFWKTRVAIDDSGDVLIVVSLKAFPVNKEERLFYVFKMNLEGDEWERLDSLGGDKVLVFGDGVIVAASDGGGKIKRDSIYFVADDVYPLRSPSMLQSCGTFDLATAKLSWSRCPYFLSNIRWFVPGSDRK
ncbi:unnamed protein product [Microthlaspi erraticum]|uniref:F-box domain-containing protein n=1 Tax=Microthlaspi erraticum TaxID=1685480 RepID=A0A6D2K8X3_9BRAS|nr:unnamed protein product [Microthlaspi erraticum]